jgi:hypothetical protein
LWVYGMYPLVRREARQGVLCLRKYVWPWFVSKYGRVIMCDHVWGIVD